jgi:hypothetical protein
VAIKHSFLVGCGIVLITAICVGIFCLRLSTIKKDDATAAYGVDFISYYTAARLIEKGDLPEIYAEIKDDFSTVVPGPFSLEAREAGFPHPPTRYVYLPLFLALFKPLAGLSFPAAANAWLVINLLCLAAAIAIEWSLTDGPYHPALRLMAVCALNLGSFPLFYALKLGQTSILVYAIICAIYYCTVKNRDALAGILLGIIAVLKFSPLLFVLYFLYRKRYTLVIACVLTLLALPAASLLVYGLHLHELYGSYLLRLSGLGIAAWSNQSMEGFMLRLFSGDTIFSFRPVAMSRPLSITKYGILLVLAGLVYMSMGKQTGATRRQAYPMEFSAVLLCMLIMPSISWLHYFSLATLPLILVLTFCFEHYPHRPGRIMIPALISYVMISIHPHADYVVSILDRRFSAATLVSFPFLGACSLLCISLLLMKKDAAALKL